MNRFALAAALGATSLALAACGDSGTRTADANNGAAVDLNATTTVEGNAATAWSKDSRIVEENGVTYRVDADGTRVALGPNESRIVVENKVRYRVGSDGSRVKIDERGIDLPDIDLPDVTPDVDIGTNEKGNPDIDVKGDKDGDKGPN